MGIQPALGGRVGRGGQDCDKRWVFNPATVCLGCLFGACVASVRLLAYSVRADMCLLLCVQASQTLRMEWPALLPGMTTASPASSML